MSVTHTDSGESLALAHLSLDVSDLARSIHFYQTELGLDVERTATSATVRCPSFLFVLTCGVPRASEAFHFGFRVGTAAAVDGWARRLRERGLTLITEPEQRGSVYVFRIANPDGYIIEMFAFV